MYYLEVRYHPKNNKRVVSILNDVKNKLEVFSTIENNNYLCVKLICDIDKEIINKLKRNKFFYFVTYYKI